MTNAAHKNTGRPYTLMKSNHQKIRKVCRRSVIRHDNGKIVQWIFLGHKQNNSARLDRLTNMLPGKLEKTFEKKAKKKDLSIAA
ncbi:MAG: hypothetical protein M8357_05575 [Desulfobulbaceae bacterium]|nr:hypothetical protein [Desulfobulbaceae bacterium]